MSECDTRWGSTQAMVKRLLYMENEVKQVLVKDRKTAHLVPSWQDTAVLESFNEPLAELTDIMSGSKYVTASCLSAMLQRLEKQILAIISSESENETESEDLLSNQLRQNILNDLLPRYTSHDDAVLLLNVTSFLDPRFKATFLTRENRVFDGEIENLSDHQSELNCVKNRLSEDCASHMESNQVESNNTATGSEESTTVTGPTPAKKKKTVTLGSWLSRHSLESTTDSLPRVTNHKQKISQEIELYAALPCSDYEINPLTWWHDHVLVYPALAYVAKKYLCIQASSSPSERLFSKAGQVITSKRT